MPPEILTILESLGVPGSIAALIVWLWFQSHRSRESMEQFKTNHMAHMQSTLDNIANSVSEGNEATRLAEREQLTALRGIEKEVGLMHQTVDNIWQRREG